MRLQVGGFAPTDKYFYYDGMEVIQDNHAACDQPLARYMYGGQANEVLTFDKYEDPCPALLAEEEEPVEGQPIEGQPIQGSGTGTGLQPGGQLPLGGGPTLTETLYYVHDANLWIVAIEDAAGEIVERTSYDDPYGNPLYTDEARNLNADQTQSSTGSPFLMRAYRLDPDATGEEGIGLVYLINRHYDTHTGNFIQRDPLMIWGDIPKYRTPGSYHAVTGFANPYPYTTNNLINAWDPYGLSDWSWGTDLLNAVENIYYDAKTIVEYAGMTYRSHTHQATDEDIVWMEEYLAKTAEDIEDAAKKVSDKTGIDAVGVQIEGSKDIMPGVYIKLGYCINFDLDDVFGDNTGQYRIAGCLPDHPMAYQFKRMPPGSSLKKNLRLGVDRFSSLRKYQWEE